MIRRTKTGVCVVAFLALAALLPACGSAGGPVAKTAEARIQERTKEQKIELGRQHKTAADLFQALRDEAKGGQRLASNGLPDWRGVYSRPATNGFTFDPDQPEGALPTAKLTPEFQTKMLKRRSGSPLSGPTARNSTRARALP